MKKHIISAIIASVIPAMTKSEFVYTTSIHHSRQHGTARTPFCGVNRTEKVAVLKWLISFGTVPMFSGTRCYFNQRRKGDSKIGSNACNSVLIHMYNVLKTKPISIINNCFFFHY